MDPLIDSEGTEFVPTATPADWVFPPKKGAIRRAMVSLVPGVLLVAGTFLLTIMYATRVPASPDRNLNPGLNFRFIAMLVPAIFGGFLILRGLSLLRLTRRVVLSHKGLRVDGIWSRRTVLWNDIRAIDRGKRGIPYSDQGIPTIEVLDGRGRKRALVTDSIEGFEQLAQALIARSSTVAGRPTHRPEETAARQISRNAKNIRWVGWCFVLFAVGMAAGFVAGIYEETHLRRFPTEGVTVEAQVVRAWMVNVTPHIEYRFQDASGKNVSRETSLYSGREWEQAQANRTIMVEYLPSAPQWNRPVSGEDAGPNFGGSFLYVTGAGFLMCGALAAFGLLGYDFRSDNGVNRLMRHGRVIREWGPNATSSLHDQNQ